jgi:RecA-family ATPase
MNNETDMPPPKKDAPAGAEALDKNQQDQCKPASAVAQSKIDRARAWLRNTPGAVAGQGGHNATFAVATALIHGFELNEGDADTLLNEYNSKCLPPWKPHELAHKLDQASKVSHDKPRGWLLSAQSGIGQGGNPISPTGKFVVRTIQTMPEPPSPFTTIDFLKACFESDEVVCICNDIIFDEEGRGRPASKGTFLKRDEWIKNHFTPPISAMWNGSDSKGAYVRINPCFDESGSDSGVANFRHVLVEMDEKTKDEQWTILKESKLPLSVVIDSGGKSLHGWVRVEAANREEWNERRDVVYRQLEALGIDPKNKNASRFSRLAGVMRDGKEQKLLAINVGSVNWDAWMRQRSLLGAVSLFDMKLPSASGSPNDIFVKGYLRKHGGLLLVGPTGIGKSSFLIQCCIAWSLGQPLFGITPTRPLKTLVIQAENDDEDMAEMRDGVVKGLSLTEEQMGQIHASIHVVSESGKTAKSLFDETLEPLLAAYKPDILILDPLFAYMGGNASDQENASKFLRQILAPSLERHGCAAILVHHTNKPPREPQGKGFKRPTSESAYDGAGSAELANWPRAVLSISATSTPGTFQLTAGKRAKKLGWKDRSGSPVNQIYIKHSLDKMFWESADQAAPLFQVERPTATVEDVLACVPMTGSIAKKKLNEKRATANCGRDKWQDFIKQLIHEKRLFEWTKPRKHTCPEPFVSRKPLSPETDLTDLTELK